MLLGKKSKLEKQAKWALILDRPQDEFSKNRTVTKLAQSFPLSPEEARDLVDNTPLILLDDLSHEDGAKAKEYFSKAKVDCFLTSDTLTKRKCFRTVWPETLDISTLLREELGQEEPATDLSELDSERPQVAALPGSPEMRSISQFAVSEPPPAQTGSLEQLSKEQKQLRTLTLELQKENEKLRLQTETVVDEVKVRERERFDKKAQEFETDRSRLENELRRIHDENVKLHSEAAQLQEDTKKLVEAAERQAIEDVRKQSAEWEAKLEEVRAECERLQTLADDTKRECKRFEMELSREQEARRRAEKGEKQCQSEWEQAQKDLL